LGSREKGSKRNVCINLGEVEKGGNSLYWFDEFDERNVIREIELMKGKK
jgi:hypothetical protein